MTYSTLPAPCSRLIQSTRYDPIIRTRCNHRHNPNGFTNFVARKAQAAPNAGTRGAVSGSRIVSRAVGGMLSPSRREHGRSVSEHAYPLPRESMAPVTRSNAMGGMLSPSRREHVGAHRLDSHHSTVTMKRVHSFRLKETRRGYQTARFTESDSICCRLA
jgi:hypothetical protein